MTSQELDEVRPVRRRRAWYKRRDILFILTVAIIWLGWEGYGHVTGPQRITDALATELDKGPETINILVTAKFRPERFHSNIYNGVGIQRGTDGRTTKLFRADPSRIKWLSRQYWIDEIDLSPDQGR